MKKWLEIAGIAILAILFIYFAGTKPASKEDTSVTTQTLKWDKPPAMEIDINKKYSVILTTSKGNITIELFAKEVPNTVNNFVFLNKQKFYDNVKFHRIIKGFMAQTGDPVGTGSGGPGYAFADEKVTREYERGIVAMANSGANTNGSQFFIMFAKNDLPKNYTIFGQINPDDKDSLATLDKIGEVPVEANQSGEVSQPKEEVVINSTQVREE